jgi:hypothetical protein
MTGPRGMRPSAASALNCGVARFGADGRRISGCRCCTVRFALYDVLLRRGCVLSSRCSQLDRAPAGAQLFAFRMPAATTGVRHSRGNTMCR